MKRYKEAMDDLRAPDALREAIAALPQETRRPNRYGKRRVAAIAAVLVVVLLAGVISIPLLSVATRKAGSSYDAAYDREAYFSGSENSAMVSDEAMYDAMPAEAEYQQYTASGKSAAEASAALPKNRKLIRDAHLSVETQDYDRFLSALYSKLNALHGYIESSDSSAGYSGNRCCTLVLRVPADSLDAFLTHIGETGAVTSQSTSVQDVTDSYIDIESRIASLETEQETLLELLKKADKLTDVLEIQNRLSEVRASLESYKGRLQALEGMVAYSTVTIELDEVQRESTPEGKTFIEQVRTNLSDNLYNLGQGFRSFAIWFLSSLPYIFLWLCGIGIVVFIVVRVRRRRRR